MRFVSWNIIVVLALAASLIQCKKNKQASASKAFNGKPLSAIGINPQYSYLGSTDPFTTIAPSISGDTLIVPVSYGGGCKDHVFTLHGNGQWMKSLPPKANLWMEHESNDDGCRAIVYDTLYFDLQTMRYKGQNKVVIQLQTPDGVVPLTYSY